MPPLEYEYPVLIEHEINCELIIVVLALVKTISRSLPDPIIVLLSSLEMTPPLTLVALQFLKIQFSIVKFEALLVITPAEF